MTWRSTNIWYAVFLAPLLLATGAVAVAALYPSWWSAPPALATIGVLALGARKLAHLPRLPASYGEMAEIRLPLPCDYGVVVKSCPVMDRHDFIPRVAELLSPWRFAAGAKPVVAVSPRFLKENGERFLAMAVVREIERYRRCFQLKTIVQLLAPLFVLVISSLYLLFFASERVGPFGRHFIAPVIFSGAFIGVFLMWNHRLSRRESEIDAALAETFPAEVVKEFIGITERLERRGESDKCREFNCYYAKKRLNRLE